MEFKKLVSMLIITCLLMIAISPLAARNTPYPEQPRDTAHPWQDDDQYSEPLDFARVDLPIGPIVISVEIPVKWFGFTGHSPYKNPTSASASVRSPKPMSLNQKGDTR